MLAQELPGLGHEQADVQIIPLYLDTLADPAWRRAVVRGLDFHAAIEMNGAVAVAVVAKRFHRKRPRAVEADAIAAQTLLAPFMAVETELDRIRQVRSDLEERRPHKLAVRLAKTVMLEEIVDERSSKPYAVLFEVRRQRFLDGPPRRQHDRAPRLIEHDKSLVRRRVWQW